MASIFEYPILGSLVWRYNGRKYIKQRRYEPLVEDLAEKNTITEGARRRRTMGLILESGFVS
jgi:hypothetical protein